MVIRIGYGSDGTLYLSNPSTMAWGYVKDMMNGAVIGGNEGGMGLVDWFKGTRRGGMELDALYSVRRALVKPAKD